MAVEVQHGATASSGLPRDAVPESGPEPAFNFAFSDFLRREYRFGIDPARPICSAHAKGHCPLGNECPDRHPVSAVYPNLVCKHWVRGLCKKGDTCEYLHEYNIRGMPECTYWARDGTCPKNADDCLYLHLDSDLKRPSCPHYERGFCPLGPYCANKHVRKTSICRFYMAGFCPNGKGCEEGAHPRFPEDLKKPEVRIIKTAEQKEQELLARQAKLQEEQEREFERGQDQAGPPNKWRGRGRRHAGWRRR
ncbi:MAG: hypothetical protein Q9165_007227 [Trypethelium subeluteriae]